MYIFRTIVSIVSQYCLYSPGDALIERNIYIYRFSKCFIVKRVPLRTITTSISFIHTGYVLSKTKNALLMSIYDFTSFFYFGREIEIVNSIKKIFSKGFLICPIGHTLRQVSSTSGSSFDEFSFVI